MSTAAKIHKIIKDSGFGIQKSKVDKSKMVRGYHTRSYGYYLEVEKFENPNWGINSYKRSQAGRWLNTGRIIIRHTNDEALPSLAKILRDGGVACEAEAGRLIVGEKEEWVKEWQGLTVN